MVSFYAGDEEESGDAVVEVLELAVVNGIDVARDIQEVEDRCANEQPSELTFTVGGDSRKMSLRVLDSDMIKLCIVKLSHSIKAQSVELDGLKFEMASRAQSTGVVETAGAGYDDRELRAQLAALEAALTNLAQNVQGFTEDDGTAEEEDDEDDRLEREALERDRFEAAQAAQAAKHAEEQRARAAELEEHKREKDLADAKIKAGMDDMAAKMAAMLSEQERRDLAEKLAREAAELAERLAREAAERELAQAEADRLAKAEADRLAAEKLALRNRFSRELGEVTKSPTPISFAALDVLGASATLAESRRLWRKCIRQIIRNNRQKSSAVGVLKSRALKGQSIADRLKRIEEHNFQEFKKLHAIVESLRDATQRRFSQLERDNQRRDGEVAQLTKKLNRLETRSSRDAERKAERAASELAKLTRNASELLDEFQELLRARREARPVSAARGALLAMEWDVALREKRETLQRYLASAHTLREAQHHAEQSSRQLLVGRFGASEEYDTQESDCEELEDDGDRAAAASSSSSRSVKKAAHAASASLASLASADSALARCVECCADADALAADAWRGVGKLLKRPAPVDGGAPVAVVDEEQLDAVREQLQQLAKAVGTKAESDDVAAVSKKSDALEQKVDALRLDADANRERLVAVEEARSALADQLVIMEDKLSVLDDLDRRIKKEVQRLVELLLPRGDAVKVPLVESLPIEFAATKLELEELKKQIAAQAKRVSQLFANKADRQALEVGLDLKADRADLDKYASLAIAQELDEMLRRLRTELGALRGKSDKDCKLLRRQLEQLLAEQLAKDGARDASAATTTCLTCSRDVPETAPATLDALAKHRQLLPRLGSPTSDGGQHYYAGAAVLSEDHARDHGDVVFRAGFRMPLNTTRPGTAPSGTSRDHASSGGDILDTTANTADTLQSRTTQRAGSPAPAEHAPQPRTTQFSALYDGHAPPPGNHMTTGSFANHGGRLGGKVRKPSSTVQIPSTSKKGVNTLLNRAAAMDDKALATIGQSSSTGRLPSKTSVSR